METDAVVVGNIVMHRGIQVIYRLLVSSLSSFVHLHELRPQTLACMEVPAWPFVILRVRILDS